MKEVQNDSDAVSIQDRSLLAKKLAVVLLDDKFGGRILSQLIDRSDSQTCPTLLALLKSIKSLSDKEGSLEKLTEDQIVNQCQLDQIFVNEDRGEKERKYRKAIREVFEAKQSADLPYFKEQLLNDIKIRAINDRLGESVYQLSEVEKTKNTSTINKLLKTYDITEFQESDRGLLLTPEMLDLSEEKIEEMMDLHSLVNDRFIAKQRSTLLYGETHVGKSSLIYQGLAFFSLGKEFFGYHPHQRIKSLVLGDEDDSCDIHRMFSGYIKTRILTPQECKEALSRIVIPSYDEIQDDPFDVLEFHLKQESRKGGDQFDAFVINPITNFLGKLDPSNSEAPNYYFKKVRNLMKKYNVAHIGVSHTNKMDNSKRSKMDEMYGYTGSSQWINKFRSSMLLQKTEVDGIFLLKNIKGRSRAGFAEVYLQWNSDKNCPVWNQISELEYTIAKRNKVGVETNNEKVVLNSLFTTPEDGLTIKDIAKRTSLSEKQVRNALDGLQNKGKVNNDELKKSNAHLFYKID